jgi:AcrR family transcriptional regulator
MNINLDEVKDIKISEKEQKILEAAIKIFSEKGYSAATTSEIAKEAGVAEGTIFRYFKTKKDLLRGILIRLVNLVGSKVVLEGIEKILLDADKKDIRQVFKEIVYDRLKLAESLYPMIRVVMTEAIYHEDVREALYKNIIEKALEMFKKFYGVMVEKGIMRADIDATTVFRLIVANIGLLVLQKNWFSKNIAIKNMDEELDQVVEIILNGISPKQS